MEEDKVKEYIFLKMAINILAVGKMTKNMVLANLNILMVTFMKGIFKMV